jgi:hypothetical protein
LRIIARRRQLSLEPKKKIRWQRRGPLQVAEIINVLDEVFAIVPCCNLQFFVFPLGHMLRRQVASNNDGERGRYEDETRQCMVAGELYGCAKGQHKKKRSFRPSVLLHCLH